MRTLPYAGTVRFALALAVLVVALPGQRPRSAAEALGRYEQIRDRGEAERRRAVDDLGAFAEGEVTTVLLAELERAQELGFRQVVVRALGRQRRDGVVPALQKALEAATNPRLADSAAEGLARQGDDGVVVGMAVAG